MPVVATESNAAHFQIKDAMMIGLALNLKKRNGKGKAVTTGPDVEDENWQTEAYLPQAIQVVLATLSFSRVDRPQKSGHLYVQLSLGDISRICGTF